MFHTILKGGAHSTAGTRHRGYHEIRVTEEDVLKITLSISFQLRVLNFGPTDPVHVMPRSRGLHVTSAGDTPTEQTIATHLSSCSLVEFLKLQTLSFGSTIT